MAKPDLNAPDPVTSPAHFKDSLTDAERLLKYAAETGVEVDVSVRAAVLQARSIPYSQWTEVTIENLLDALTKLAALLKPVTAASLTAWSNDTSATVLYYLRVAIILACVIVPASIASFATSALSNSLRADIASANDLAVKLRAQLGAVPPPAQPGATTPSLPPGVNEAEIIAELQEYASTIRLIDSRARELNWLVLPRVSPPLQAGAATRRAAPSLNSTQSSPTTTRPATAPPPPFNPSATSPRACSITSPSSMERSTPASSLSSTLCSAPAPICCATSRAR